MEKIKCSVPILTLNCAKELERCLESVKDLSDKIILDGNSTDGTQVVAQKYGARIYKQFDTDEPNQRITDFTSMRLKALEQITENWILCIDSDEWLGPGLADEIRLATERNNVKVAYQIPRIVILDNGKIIKHAFSYPNAQIRLYHKDSGIGPKEGKAVHESDYIPEDVTRETTIGVIFTKWPPLSDLYKKDGHYLGIVKKSLMEKVPKMARTSALRKSAINIFKASKIFLKSFYLCLRYGTENTLPLNYSWRHIRYHLKIAVMVFKIKFLNQQ